jgi:hypothetical protein
MCCGALCAQSETIEKASDQDGCMTAYVYQSMLRAIFQSPDPNFAKFVKDLDHIKVIMIGDISAEGTTEKTIVGFENQLNAEGYEEYMSITKGDKSFRVFNLDANQEHPSFVISVISNGVPFLIETVGTLDMKYLKSIESVDLTQAMDYLSGGFIFR